MELEPGLYEGLTRAEYDQIDAANYSFLKELWTRTPLHAYRSSLEVRESEALSVGDATHKAILEPGAFEREYYLVPERFDDELVEQVRAFEPELADAPVPDSGLVNRRSKLDQAALEMAAAKHPGATGLKPADWETAVGLRESILRNPTAAEFMEGAVAFELTLVWRDEETGVLCKGRCDVFGTYRGAEFIYDLKSIRDATQHAFERAVGEYRWDMQDGFYTSGFDALAPSTSRIFVFGCYEKSTRIMQHFRLNEVDRAQGLWACRRALTTYARCRERGRWPGYPQGLTKARTPAWVAQVDEEAAERRIR